MSEAEMALDLLRRFVNASYGGALMTQDDLDPSTGGIALIDSSWVDVDAAEMAFLRSLVEDR